MGANPKVGRLCALDEWALSWHAPAACDRPCCIAPPSAPAALLDVLPDCLLRLNLLPALSAEDKKAFRAASPFSRALVNSAVTRVRVAAGDLLPAGRPGAAAPRLGRRFPALRELEVFDCAEAPVSDERLVAFLSDCGRELLSQISKFDLKRCHYVGRNLLEFLKTHCSGLTCLSASRWTDNVTLAAIGRLSGLQELDLGDADAIDDSGLLSLRGMSALRVLGLQRCRYIGDAGCRALAQITSLEDLSVAGTDVGPDGLRELSRLPRLRRLDVSGALRAAGDEGLSALAEASPPALEALELRGTPAKRRGLGALGWFGRLTSVDLGPKYELDDEGVAMLADCRVLVSLSAGSFNLTRPPPAGFGARLERLSFGGGSANKGLEMLFPLPALRSVHATGIDTVTDRVMRTLSCQATLEELALRSGYSLTKAGLASALQALPRLQAVSVSSCPAINDAALTAFAAAHPRLSAGALPARNGTVRAA